MSKLIKQDELIIAEYFCNGYNGTAAVLSVYPEMNRNVAAVKWQHIKNNSNNQDIIGEHQARLKSQTEVGSEKILKELLNWLYVDATDFMELTPNEIKELPAEVRRCIQSYKSKEQYDKHGNHVATTVEVRLIDKTKAIEAINKHIGFYAQDNDQKANKIQMINVLKSMDGDTLDRFRIALESQEE